MKFNRQGPARFETLRHASYHRRGFCVNKARAADAKEVGVENSAEETYHSPDLRHPIHLTLQVNNCDTGL